MATLEPTDIVCSVSGCPARTPRRETDDYARAKGWHIWGVKALCPNHAGNRPREKPVQLEGEVPLW